MPFSDFLKGKKSSAAQDAASAATASLTGEAKLSIIEQIEDSGAIGFWATDAAGRIIYLSPAILGSLVRDAGDFDGQPLQQLLSPVASEGEGRSLGLKLSTRKTFANLTVQANLPDSPVVLKLSGRPLYDDNAEFMGFRGSAVDVTEEFRSEEEASRLAKFDTLTGLANRYRMEQRIDATLHAFKSAQRSAALMMLDLDKFKLINDTLGHAAGDRLLQQVAERLRGVIGGRGEIGRLGGDEFQVLLPDLDDRGELGEIAKRTIQLLSQPYALEEGRAIIGCSIGVAIAPYDGVTREEVSRAADLALYASKSGGRGRFRFYAADLEHEADLRRRMEEDLSDAIERGHFTLEYQPVVSLADNRVVALETVYCWSDEERGRVPPETFLPVAEGSRLIVPIGEWALRRACEDALAWPESLRISLLVSPVQFENNDFVASIERAIDATGIDPARLELRLPESVLLGEASKVDTALAALFKLGVRLTLDQFGTGLSSLAYLRRAPLSALRIGSDFFEPVIGNELGDMEMVRAVIALSNAMGMETTASGVHAIDLMTELKTLGVDQVSGFVYSEALSGERVADQLAKGEWSLAPTDSGSQRASRRTVFRKIGLIHQDYCYEVTLRNLSRSGAMIQGLEGVPVGTKFVLDFGGGQLAVCTVRRTMDDTQGIEFEQELVDDGAGGLCTRHRVSPYELAAAGASPSALPAGRHIMTGSAPASGSFPQFQLSGNAPAKAGSREAV